MVYQYSTHICEACGMEWMTHEDALLCENAAVTEKTHYVPGDTVYVIHRYDDESTLPTKDVVVDVVYQPVFPDDRILTKENGFHTLCIKTKKVHQLGKTYWTVFIPLEYIVALDEWNPCLQFPPPRRRPNDL